VLAKPLTLCDGKNMTKLTFTTMNDLQQEAEVLSMMQALYAEDEAASPVDQSRFAANIEFLAAHPSRGSIVLFREPDALVGYALLVPYWSNEFCGTLLYVDEMCVVPRARRRGIGTSFFSFIEKERPFEAVALALEVSPGNEDARWLYQSLGFRPRRNTILASRLEEIG